MKTLTALAVVGVAASVALTGCSTIKDSLSNRHELAYDDYSAAADNWNGLPDWVPTDATGIRVRETTDAPIAVAEVLTETDPVGCEKSTRQYIPGIGGDWEPTDYPHAILRCGDWEVMTVDGGYFGWTIDANKMQSPYTSS